MIFKKIYTTCLSLALATTFSLVGLFNQPRKAEAATFNPNNLVSDAAFVNYSTMNATQINDFLKSKGSVYYNYVIPYWAYVPFPYRHSSGSAAWSAVWVKQYNDGTGENLSGITVAARIAAEARQHSFNPQAMLALMERESSTVTRSSVSDTCKAWPVFYGFNEVMASYNYNYTDAKQRAIYYGGVGQQIAYATNNLRTRHANLLGTNWQAAMSIDGTTIYPASRATRVMYIYTPHIYNGNYNFWYFMQNWFNGGTYVVGSFGPVPNTELKTYGGNYYLVFNNTRYYMGTSSRLVRSYGYSTTDAETWTLEQRNATDYGTTLSHYIRSGNYRYYVSGGLKYRVTMTKTFMKRWDLWYRYCPRLPDAMISAIPSAPYALSGIVKSNNSSYYYYVDRGMRYRIWPTRAFKDRWGVKDSEVITISSEALERMPRTRNLTGLVRGVTVRQVYYIDNFGKRYKVPANSLFWQHWGFRNSDVSTISDEQLYFIRYGGGLERYVKGHKYYYTCMMDWGKCKWTSPKIYGVSVLSQSQFNYLPKK